MQSKHSNPQQDDEEVSSHLYEKLGRNKMHSQAEPRHHKMYGGPNRRSKRRQHHWGRQQHRLIEQERLENLEADINEAEDMFR